VLNGIESKGIAVNGIDYIVRVDPAATPHHLDVTALIPTGGRPALDVFMAVWTPGSYLVREFARNVLTIEACGDDGRIVSVSKTAKNRWTLDGVAGCEHVRIDYRLYAREMSVRTNVVDRDFALLNGAATFITCASAQQAPSTVRVVLPPGWAAHTSLDAAGDGSAAFLARDFDALVDAPIGCGEAVVSVFDAGGRRHEIVDLGDRGPWDSAAAAKDVQRVVETQQAFWRSVPYERYVFLNCVSESAGGLEHAASTVLMTSRWKSRTRKGHLEWLRLASHEFFHTWNVKRLRPVELGPFDYERENHTRALWIAEGFTEYYGDLLVRRAGLCTDREYLDELGAQIEHVETTPGRRVQPLSLASFDAWIKHYRPDENSPNAAMSYYTKGCVVAFLLDAEIRRATDNLRSLDDVMRAAYERYAGARGYEERQFRDLAGEIAGVDLSAWLAHAVDSTGELEYEPALELFGLRLRTEDLPSDRPPRAFFGVTTRNDAGRLVVTSVRASTPAASAGVSPDDEILALGGYRVRADGFESRLEIHRPGETLPLLVARRERLIELSITLGEAPRPLKLDLDLSATPEQSERRRSWLEG
jgi:predicted metalloprotease with PDZ domain